MFLAGVQVRDALVLELAHQVEDEALADKLRAAFDRDVTALALETDERELILNALSDPRVVGFEELRNVLLQEHDRRRAGGH